MTLNDKSCFMRNWSNEVDQKEVSLWFKTNQKQEEQIYANGPRKIKIC